MPWSERSPMEDRAHFVEAAERSSCSFAELCRRFGIPPKTGYKWLKRYRLEGLAGLRDRSRRPHTSPNQTSERIVRALVRLKRREGYGAKKLLVLLGSAHPDWELPAVSTCTELLRRHGLVKSRPKRRKLSRQRLELTPPDAPNRIWTVDYKGQFKTRDGRDCYPLTIVDGYSRFLLACEALEGTGSADAYRVFLRVFRKYGLPEVIRSDNGPPFASRGLGSLSHLAVKWVRLGIYPELIQPACPGQNASHERMHKTLKEDTLWPPASNHKLQQERFRNFQRRFNYRRPHESLGQRRPAELYAASARPMPRHVPELTYPGHYERRKVDSSGWIYFKGEKLRLSKALRAEKVALVEHDHGLWRILFGPILLGYYNDRTKLIEGVAGRARNMDH